MFIINWIEWFMSNKELLAQIITPAMVLFSAYVILTVSKNDDKIAAVLISFFKSLGVYHEPPMLASDAAYQPPARKVFPKTTVVIKTGLRVVGVTLIVVAIAFAVI
jgi:hypothetical protein